MLLSGNQKPLIFFTPGARGDFLGRVITHNLEDLWTVPALLKKSDKHYKLHNVYEPIFKNDPSLLKEIFDNYSIRIRLKTIDDVLTVSYNVITKLGCPPNAQMTDVVKSVIFEEYNHRRLDSLFKHLVDFDQLSKTSFLIGFTHQLTNTVFTKDTLNQIRHNISLQQKVNLDNYQNYLNIDIKEVLKYYELGNGFN